MFPTILLALFGLLVFSFVSMWIWSDWCETSHTLLEEIRSTTLRRFILLSIAPCDIVIRIIWLIEDLIGKDDDETYGEVFTENWEDTAEDYVGVWRGDDA